MRCLQIKILTLLLIALTACSSPAERPTVSPYIEAVRLKEKFAAQQFASANYRAAMDAYAAVYSKYRGLDSYEDMARLLSNHFQTALIVEDISAAKATSQQLQTLLQQYQNTTYQQRLTLLSANLALIEQQWATAASILDELETGDGNSPTLLAAKVSRLVAEYHQGSEILPHLQRLNSTLQSEPALLARGQRLQAEIAMQTGDYLEAGNLIHRAKDYYQVISFPPGVAECLVLEAKLASHQGQTELANQLNQRAKAVFLAIDNTNAISRHKL